MSNSNGMYRVLDMFKKLEPTQEQQVKAEAKRIYDSVEAKGSILEGVNTIEQKLREQFETAKEERETLKTKTGTIYKGGTYGTEYDGNDGDKKKPKHVPKKGVKGRPKKDPAPTYSQSNDPFGRVPDKAPKGKKGTVIKGKGNVDTVDEEAKNPYAVGMAQAMKSTGDKPPLKKSTITKAHDIAKKVKVSEGVNFSEMVKKHTVTLDEMMQQLSNDIMEFKRSGHVSDTLKDCMSVYEYGKQQLTDSAHTQHALDLNPDLKSMAQPQKPSVLGKVGDIAKKGLDVLTGPDDEGQLRDLARKTFGEEEELNELARLAGLSVSENKKSDAEMEEGNEFSGELAKAKATGKKEFEVDGKTYPVKEAAKPDFLDMDKDGDKKEPMKKALKDKDQVDECMSPIGGMASDMEQQEGKINVNTNMSSDGHKSVSINADGDAAEQLMQMLKAAGIGSEQAQKHVQLVIAKPQAPEEEMAEATDQYANTPEEEYEGVDAIINQGDDMNRQKRQFADKPRAGDNPMATPEGVDPVAELGRNLMQEYESLKLAK